MLTDTHCHLYSNEFTADVDAMMARATMEGVTRFYLPAIDSGTTVAMLALESRYPGKCFAMAGLHPCSVKEDYNNELLAIEKLLNERSFAAIGETGLDFYWDKTFIKQQYDALEQQCVLALRHQLPIVLHTRNATQETISVIRKYADKGLKGIFHCFGGSLTDAEQITDIGFYLGIGGVVTYKNAGLDVILKNISLDHIVLETDAPYLAPSPFRGKRNESSYLKFIAAKIAEIKNVSVEEVADITTRNALMIFPLS